METEIGKVIGTRPGYARIEVMQSCVCSQCKVAASCVHDTGGTRIIEVRDPLGVSLNQRVRVELASASLIGASFLAYILPLITLFAGALLGFFLPAGAGNETWAGIGALCGLGIGVIVSRLTGQWLGKRGKITPTITAVVADDGKENQHAD
jgi:sigma-E factor negative regulatory protein RseC